MEHLLMTAGQEFICELDSREPQLPSKEDRRVYFRERVLLSALELEDGNRGIVLDISEQGLAMQSAQTLNTESAPRLRFQLSESKWIEAEGRFAWVSPSGCAAGVEFNELSLDALITIKTWMFEIASLGSDDQIEIDLSDADDPLSPAICDELPPKSDEAPPTEQAVESLSLGGVVIDEPNRDVANEEKADAESRLLFEEFPSGELPNEPGRSEPRLLSKSVLESSRLAAARWPVSIALAMWTAILAGFLVFGWHRRMENPRSPERITAGRGFENTTLEQNRTAVAGSNPVSNASASPDDFGIVLQVAAMQSESGALAIADVFRAKNLSAFVMKPAGKNLYLVLIGPYGDAASAGHARAELKRMGVDSIQRRGSSLQ